jgi:virginiamycin B lyase
MSYYPTNDPDTPGGLTVGPDHALWFTNADGVIDRITTAGKITHFATTMEDPGGIIYAPDGDLWFTGTGVSIGRMNGAGVSVLFPTHNSYHDGSGITLGPGGTIWITNPTDNAIGRFDPANHQLTFYCGGGPGEYCANAPDIMQYPKGVEDPAGLVEGPDKAMWFTSNQLGYIGRITASGQVTVFQDQQLRIQFPTSIAVGPDGALWFTNEQNPQGSQMPASETGTIGRITTSGQISIFSNPNLSTPSGLFRYHGALWFINGGDGVPVTFGHISMKGVITFSKIPEATAAA